MSPIFYVAMEHSETNKRLQLLTEMLNSMTEDIKQFKQTTPHPSNNEWLHTADVMRKMGVSQSTIKRWRKNNAIPYVKIGQSYWYPSSFFDTTMLQNALKNIMK